MDIMKEYAIWGIPENSDEEQLLITKVGGVIISSLNDAKEAAKVLRNKYKVRDTRIQEIDLFALYDAQKEFLKTINN